MKLENFAEVSVDVVGTMFLISFVSSSELLFDDSVLHCPPFSRVTSIS